MFSLSIYIILVQALKLKENKVVLSMKYDSRRRRNGSPADRINEIIPHPQRDRQVRAAAPEGAFRFIQELRCRWVRDRPDPGLPQDLPRQARPVQVQEGPDPVSVGLAPGTVTDDQQLIREATMDRRFMKTVSGTSGRFEAAASGG